MTNKQHNKSLTNSLERFYLAALLATLCGISADAQTLHLAPRLVVNITIDQLRTDYLEHFSPLYKQEGFRKLLQEGKVYEAVSYPFSPVDRASAVACIATGTTPQFNKIISEQWMNRTTLRPEYCVNDANHKLSPEHIACSTIGDELKMATNGRAIVYGVARNEDAAILGGGHAADGAFWMDRETYEWKTSTYYPALAQKWVNAYNVIAAQQNKHKYFNELVCDLALGCIRDNAMGRDDITDYISMTLSARLGEAMGQRKEMESVYISLDKTIGEFITEVETKIGKDKVLFVLTATGDTDEPKVDYAKYHIPTGTFYINRTAQLLNMYLGAVYGTGKYIDTYYKNQIFLNHKLIESKTISYSEIIQRSKDLLMMTSGVAAVENAPYDTTIDGDLIITVQPGWQILNEDTGDSYMARTTFVPFPVIFYGANIKAEHIQTPITTECIAPTIAKSIHIRAPNACAAKPLF